MNKKASVDFTWLPLREEWDFRAVTEEDCRVACYWEYKREFGYVPTSDTRAVKKGGILWPDSHLQPVKAKPWLCLTEAERTATKAAHVPAPSVQVRSFREFMKRVPVDAREDYNVWRRYTESTYVIRPNFDAGVESVIAMLERWARSEAKKFQRSPRAKAAAPPFHLLRWLAAYRLDQCAKQAELTYRAIEESLQEYRNQNRRKSHGDVFPGGYGSQGAWSKACRDAQKIGQIVVHDPMAIVRASFSARRENGGDSEN